MRAEIVHGSMGNCHKYGSAVLHRAVRFSIENDLDSDPEVLWHALAKDMWSAQPGSLLIAAIQDERVKGHLLARLNDYDGTRAVFITHLQIDSEAEEDRMQVMADGRDMFVKWGLENGATKIRCWAMNEKLGKLFQHPRFGMKPKDYVLMEASLDAEKPQEA
jgi:hypothetical protein